MALHRVTKSNRCPICLKGDWCLCSDDIAICMRVVSQNPHTFADGSVGYIHVIGDGSPPTAFLYKRTEPEKKPINVDEILAEWRLRFGISSLTYLGKSLGVTPESLQLLGCAKAPQHSVWAFPMCDEHSNRVGIRMRHENGKKWSEPGSQNGLFIPKIPPDKTMAICEGPTDTAAALTIGVYAIGRFNNCGGVNMIIEFIRLNKIRRVIIMADCDQDKVLHGQVVNPGIRGAMNLSELLPVPSCTLALPTKDMREFVQRGGNLKTFNAMASQLVWHNPK